MKKIKQKILLFIAIILLLTGIILVFNYTINSIYINKYKHSIYKPNIAKKLLYINIQEQYIAHYNYGTSLYKTKQYKEAKKEFSKALKTTPQKRICHVRVNLALTEIKLLTDNYNIEKINKIQNILLKNNCATKNQNGIDNKSQMLYDYLEQQKNSSNKNNSNENNKDNNTKDKAIENEEDKINSIKNKDRKSAGERNPSEEREYNKNNYKEAIW